jgi:hypothetical protein
MVYDGKDGVLPFAHWEACDEVHGHLLEGESVVGSRDMVYGSACFMHDDLVLLASHTSLYVVSYPSVHSLPQTTLLYSSYCLVTSRVAGCGMIVCPCHQCLSFLCRWRYAYFHCVDELLAREHRNTLVIILSLVGIWRMR